MPLPKGLPWGVLLQGPSPTVLPKPQEVQTVKDAKAQRISFALHSLWTTNSTVHQPSQLMALHRG